MKKTLFFLLFVMPGLFLFAQGNYDSTYARPVNSINLSFLGDASLISINYERRFLVSHKFILSSKLGFGFNRELRICPFGPCPPTETYATIPHHITGNLGNGPHFFEFGLGGTIITGNKTQPYLLYPIVGYRILPLSSDKVNFRVFAQIPFSGLETDDITFVPLGLSVGVSF